MVDVDRNGQLDVIVATQTTGTLRWFTPVGDVKARWVENNLRDVGQDVLRIAIGDVDGDAKSDVIAPIQGAGGDTTKDAIVWCKNPE